MNKNYQKGRNKEYKIVRALRAEGFDIVQRSAGSHSPIDVFAINKKKRIIKLIQSKPDNYSEKKTIALYDELDWLKGSFVVVFEVH